MADTIHVKGLDQLQKFLDQLPAKMEANVLRGALRAGANVVKDAAVANIVSKSGVLARSLKVGTRTRGGVVTASVRSKVFYARFVEYGTRGHWITSRDGKALSIGGMFMVRAVEHPGASPRPFMRPALDTRAQEAVLATGNYIKQRLATKQGLDTSDVEISVEGDE